MRERTLVLVNPHAYQIRRGGHPCAALEQVCREAQAGLHYPNSKEALQQTLASYFDALDASEQGRVVFVGGDGTHHAGVTALHRALRGRPWPRVGLVPAGTVNTTARLWGNQGAPAVVLRKLLASQEIALRPSLLLTEEKGEQKLGFIWGAGLVSRFFELYNETGGGVLPASKLALRIATGALVGSPLSRRVLSLSPMRLTLDGVPVPKERYSLAVVSVHNSVGLGIRVTYRAEQQRDRLHLVASDASPLRLGLQGPRVLLGVPLGGPTVDALVREIRVEFPESAASILDGDWLDARAFSLRPGPTLPVLLANR